jgi:hypothetical protein
MDQPSTMSGPYRGFDDSDNVDEERNDSSCRRDSTGASAGDDDSSYQLRVDADVAIDTRSSSIVNSISSSTRSIRSLSKDMIRTFQTTIQNNSRSQILIPDDAPVSRTLQPRLQKLASETRRIVQSVQQSAIVEGVSDTFVNVNDRLGSMLMRSKSTGACPSNTDSATPYASSPSNTNCNNIDRGIYSSQSMRSWGSTISAEINTFTSQKVVPLFKRQNTYPFSTTAGGAGNQKEHAVSFDYQLMKDNE